MIIADSTKAVSRTGVARMPTAVLRCSFCRVACRARPKRDWVTTAVNSSASASSPAQMAKYHQFSGCINCGLCYAACPQFGLNPEFIGPAAITLAHRYNEDSRDHGKKERMAQLNSQNGVWSCTFVGYCSVVCPKHVDPAAAIQQGKVESSKDFLIATLKPR